MSQTPPPTLPYQSKEPAQPPHPLCPKCGTKMLQGVEFATGPRKLVWIQGETRAGWLGLDRFPRGKQFEIISFRCPGCGFIENYSPPG